MPQVRRVPSVRRVLPGKPVLPVRRVLPDQPVLLVPRDPLGKPDLRDRPVPQVPQVPQAKRVLQVRQVRREQLARPEPPVPKPSLLSLQQQWTGQPEQRHLV